jgi:hypothetical protein
MHTCSNPDPRILHPEHSPVNIGEQLTNMVQRRLRPSGYHAINTAKPCNPAAVTQLCHSELRLITPVCDNHLNAGHHNPSPSYAATPLQIATNPVYSNSRPLTKGNPYSTNAILGSLGVALHSVNVAHSLIQWFTPDATTTQLRNEYLL